MNLEFPIGFLRTVPLQDDAEIGQFDLPVMGEKNFYTLFGQSLREYVTHRISISLAHAIESTTVPSQYWEFIPDEKIRSELNYPAILSFRG